MEQTGTHVQDLPSEVEKIDAILTEEGIKHQICGRVRRWGRWVYRLNVIIVVEALTEEIHELFKELEPQTFHLKPHVTRIMIGRMKVYLVSADAEYFGSMMLFYTGPATFRKSICSDARFDGLKLSMYGLWQGKHRIAGRTEEQIFSCLGLDFVPPGKRRAYKTKLSRWRNVMREYAIEERKRVYKAIVAVFVSREKGQLPVKRSEIIKELAKIEWMEDNTLTTHMLWLKRHGLAHQTTKGWEPRQIPEEGLCWTHGKYLPCYVCQRIEDREEAKKRNWEKAKIKRKLREANGDVVLGACGC